MSGRKPNQKIRWGRMVGRGFGVLLSVACLLPMGGVGARAQQNRPDPLVPGSSGSSRAISDQQNARDYIIGPQDLLAINVWREPELSRTVQVRPDGKISLPLIEDIQASGLKPVELARVIDAKLKRFVTNPTATVIVQESNSHRVYLIGEVVRPGAYPLVPLMTVLQALATAGGFREFASVKEITVLRTVVGKSVKYPFNYKQVIRGKRTEQNILLRNGDTIIVP